MDERADAGARLREVARLQDVAQLAGVSLATASRVLNGSSRHVADAYRHRVQSAAEQLGYSPNRAAQAVARGTTDTVALLVADIADPYFSQIASGVARAAEEAGLYVTIAITGRSAEREWRLLRALRAQRPRSVILATSRETGDLLPQLRTEVDALTAAGSTVVALGSGAPQLTSVSVDNRGGASMLGRALARRGYRRAVLIGAAPGIITSDERLEGFAHGFRSTGGGILSSHHTTFTRDGGAEAMRAALASGAPKGTLVFGASDIIALGAIAALRAAGRAVGTDIAVAGFDDIPSASDVVPGLSTVNVPLEEIGYLLLRRSLSEEHREITDTPRLEVVLRGSTPGS